METWLRQAGEDVLLRLHVQPGAKRTAVAGMHGEALKIRLAAPPVEGRANDCLIDFLAASLGMAKRRVILEAGAASRDKRIRISAATAALVASRLLPPSS